MLILIRHGESTGQIEDRMCGQIDYDLTPNGIEQSKELGSMLESYGIDVVYSSPLVRSFRTAQLALAQSDIEIQVDDRLLERSSGYYEGMTYSEIRKVIPPRQYKVWQRDYFEAPPGGESMADVADRVIEFMNTMVREDYEQGKTVVIFSHSVVMKVLIGWLRQMDETEIPNQSLILNAIPYVFNSDFPPA